MKKDLISIVVPIYNVEKYVEKCVSSILIQTYSNLEIVLVDDGSTDNSGKIIDKLKNKDSRIKVIHKKNGGLSDARNCGIDNSTGKYICFIDSDDYVNSNYVEVLYKNIIKYDCDISVCSFKKVLESDEINILEEVKNDTFVLNETNIFSQLYGKFSLETIVAWNKMYKINLFDSVRYPKGKIHEDEYVIHKLLNNAKKIIYSSVPYYYYVQRNNSIVHKFSENRLDFISAYKERMTLFEKKGLDDLYSMTQYKLCYAYYTIIPEIENIELRNKIYDDFEKEYKYMLTLKNISILRKIKMYFLNKKVVRMINK